MKLITFSKNDKLLSNKDQLSLLKDNKIFVGEWCINQENIFKENKEKFYQFSHWDNTKKVTKDIKYIKKIYEKILKNLTKSLNMYHNTNYSEKYWEILLSRWLSSYISYLFDRWEISKSILKNKKIHSVINLEFKNNTFITNNSISFNNMIVSNNYWTSWIFGKIFEFNKKVKIEKKKPKTSINIYQYKLKYSNFLNFFLDKKKIFFYMFSIPLRLKLKILMKNKQFTFKTSNRTLNEFSNIKLNRISFYKYKKSKDKFLNFANNLLTQNIPKIFVENYYSLEKAHNNLNWPKKPNYIITSLAHFYDEVFKIYAAKNITNGTKFLISQHGSGYGLETNNISEDLEKKICDRFLTWGWKEDKKTFPLFITSTNIKVKNKINYPSNKKILLVVYPFPLHPGRPTVPIRSPKKRNNYIKKVISFLQILDLKNKKNLEISYWPKSFSETEKHSIHYKFQKIKFFDPRNQKKNYKDNYCIQVETWLSTGFFEAMTINKPVIVIFNKEFIYVRKSFNKYVAMLKKVNICHSNYESASKFVNQNLSNINSWWSNKELQKIRKLFTQKYCRYSENPISDFYSSINFNEK